MNTALEQTRQNLQPHVEINVDSTEGIEEFDRQIDEVAEKLLDADRQPLERLQEEFLLFDGLQKFAYVYDYDSDIDDEALYEERIGEKIDNLVATRLQDSDLSVYEQEVIEALDMRNIYNRLKEGDEAGYGKWQEKIAKYKEKYPLFLHFKDSYADHASYGGDGLSEALGRHRSNGLPGESFMERYISARTADVFGVGASDLSQSARDRLAIYGAGLKKGVHDRIVAVSGNLEGRARSQFAEAFLATEFGDDFGEKILSIVEHTSPGQSAKVFRIISEYRTLSREYGGEYSHYDKELAQATERALNERLTDMLTVVDRVAQDGAITVDTAPHQNTPDYQSDGRFDISINSVDEAIVIMEQFQKTMALRRDILDDDETIVTRVVQYEQDMGYQVYRFTSPDRADMLLHLRKEGAGRYDKAFEYGNREGVEATIGWIVNPVGDHHVASDKDPRGVSVRFDREGRLVNEMPDSAERTPVRDDGLISLDVSSVMGDPRAVPVRIGRMIAAGNVLRAKEHEGNVSLHHNTNYFDQETYGTSKGFADLAGYMQTVAEAKIAIQRLRKSGRQAVAVAAA